MVRNPVWSKPLSDYLKDFRHWVALPDEAAHMNVAIFYDARAVAGDAQLLTTAKTALIDMIRGEQVYLAHFARAVDAFATPIGLFNNLVTSEGNGDAVDLKKGGIFPVVHGIRSLALEHRLVGNGDRQAYRAAERHGCPAGGLRPRAEPDVSLPTDAQDSTGNWLHRPAARAP